MPPQTLFDIDSIDFANPIISREEIYQVNPHRHEFMQLDGICLFEPKEGRIAGVRHVRDDEFWVRGHIPSRPIFPGVLMMETAAQMVSYFVMRKFPDKGFLGFGGVDDVKFRGSVQPGDTIYMVGKMLEMRSRRCIGATQALVNDRIVYEGVITGMWV